MCSLAVVVGEKVSANDKKNNVAATTEQRFTIENYTRAVWTDRTLGLAYFLTAGMVFSLYCFYFFQLVFESWR